MIPPNSRGGVASQPPQILIKRGFQPRLSINRMVVSRDRRQVGVLVNARIGACRPFRGIDYLVCSVKQASPRHVAVFDDAAWIVRACEQVGSTDNCPPSIRQRGYEQP